MRFIFPTLNPRISLFQAGSYSKKSQFFTCFILASYFLTKFHHIEAIANKSMVQSKIAEERLLHAFFFKLSLCLSLDYFSGGRGKCSSKFVMCYLSDILEQVIFDYQHFRTEIWSINPIPKHGRNLNPMPINNAIKTCQSWVPMNMHIGTLHRYPTKATFTQGWVDHNDGCK